jgi:hypothetical protein
LQDGKTMQQEAEKLAADGPDSKLKGAMPVVKAPAEANRAARTIIHPIY